MSDHPAAVVSAPWLAHEIARDRLAAHTDTSPDELVELGLEPLELATLNVLTRYEDESFEAHALRVAYAKGPEGVLARAVRRADIDDHLARMPSTATAPYYWARRHVMR